MRPLLAGVLQSLHLLLIGERAHGFPARFAEIEGADGRDGLDAQLGLSIAQGIAAAGADAERADPLSIQLGMLHEKVDGAADVVQALRRNLHEARLAAAFALIGGIIGQGNKTLLGKMLGIKAGSLLLHATEGMSDHDGRVLLACIEAGRLEEVADDCRSHVPGRVSDPLDRHTLPIGISDHGRALNRSGLSGRRGGHSES
jgi:hypothetical protein